MADLMGGLPPLTILRTGLAPGLELNDQRKQSEDLCALMAHLVAAAAGNTASIYYLGTWLDTPSLSFVNR